MLVTFAEKTQALYKTVKRRIAIRAVWVAAVVGLIFIFFGYLFMEVFKFSTTAMSLAGGLILLVYSIKSILKEPKGALTKQYRALLATEGVALSFDDSAIREIAAIAFDLNQTTENIGARRLATVMEKLMEEISYSAEEHAGQKLRIDQDYVRTCLADISQDPDLSRYIL